MKLYDVGCITGVFDLFHIGHLNILRRAKEHCGRLIAGVNAVFHGNDWKASEPYNDIRLRLKTVNVDVIFLPRTEGISTTIITEMIRRK